MPCRICLFIFMRSVTIIPKVKPSSLLLSSSKSKPNNISFVRRPKSNQQYHHKLQSLRKLKNQSSQANKQRDHKKIYNSLSISTINVCPRESSLSAPSVAPKKNNQEKKPAINTLQKVRSYRFQEIKIPSNMSEQLSSVLSRVKNFNRYSRVKSITQLKYRKNISIIISADFLLDQFSFWEQPSLEDNSKLIINFWKSMSKLVNMYWVVHTQVVATIITNFCQINNLTLDGILLIESSRQESIKISYKNFQNQLMIPPKDKILIINSIKSSETDNMEPFQFKNSLPLIAHTLTFVHFIKIDINDKNRLNLISKIMTLQLPKAFNINKIIKNFSEQKVICMHRLADEEKQQTDLQIQSLAYKTLERAKNNLYVYFEQAKSLNKKIDNKSVAFMIGDTLRRNVRVAKQRQSYILEYKNRRDNLEYRQIAKKYNRKTQKQQSEYHRPVFIWQF